MPDCLVVQVEVGERGSGQQFNAPFARCRHEQQRVSLIAVARGEQVTRVQMQLDAEGGAKRQFTSALQCVRHIAKAEGAKGCARPPLVERAWSHVLQVAYEPPPPLVYACRLYAGLSAGVFRQVRVATR